MRYNGRVYFQARQRRARLSNGHLLGTRTQPAAEQGQTLDGVRAMQPHRPSEHLEQPFQRLDTLDQVGGADENQEGVSAFLNPTPSKSMPQIFHES